MTHQQQHKALSFQDASLHYLLFQCFLRPLKEELVVPHSCRLKRILIYVSVPLVRPTSWPPHWIPTVFTKRGARELMHSPRGGVTLVGNPNFAMHIQKGCIGLYIIVRYLYKIVLYMEGSSPHCLVPGVHKLLWVPKLRRYDKCKCSSPMFDHIKKYIFVYHISDVNLRLCYGPSQKLFERFGCRKCCFSCVVPPMESFYLIKGAPNELLCIMHDTCVTCVTNTTLLCNLT